MSNSGKRAYDDACGVARALNLVGERWALLIVRELLFGAKRFSDLQRGLPTISPNVLSQRLRDLEADGIVAPSRRGPPVGATVYDLTDRGRGLEPVLYELATWGSRTPLRSEAELSVDALILALQTTVDPGRPSVEGVFALRFGDDTVTVQVKGRTLTALRSSGKPPTATISSDVATLRAVVFGDRDIATARRSGELSIEGDARTARRFLGLFTRPTTA